MVLLEVKLTLGAPPAHRGEDGNAGPGRPLQPGGASQGYQVHPSCTSLKSAKVRSLLKFEVRPRKIFAHEPDKP